MYTKRGREGVRLGEDQAADRLWMARTERWSTQHSDGSSITSEAALLLLLVTSGRHGALAVWHVASDTQYRSVQQRQRGWKVSVWWVECEVSAACRLSVCGCQAGTEQYCPLWVCLRVCASPHFSRSPQHVGLYERSGKRSRARNSNWLYAMLFASRCPHCTLQRSEGGGATASLRTIPLTAQRSQALSGYHTVGSSLHVVFIISHRL